MECLEVLLFAQANLAGQPDAPLAPGAGIPTGTVTLKDGNKTIGTFNLTSTTGGVATFTVSFTTAGTHSITAVYGGDTDFAG